MRDIQVLHWDDDASFWDQFMAQFWERSPVLIKSARTPWWMERSFFSSTVRACFGLPAFDAGVRSRAFVGGRLVQGWPDEVFYQVPADQDFELTATALHERLGTDFGMIFNEVTAISAPLWNALTEFAAPIVRAVGYPTSMFHAGIFCGTYAMTPFGVHIDASGGFMFHIVGRKTFHFWERERFADDPRRCEFLRGGGASLLADPHSLLDASIVAEIDGGDILYWPSSFWHVGLGVGGSPHGGLTLGFWDRRRHSQILGEVVEQLVRERLGVEDAWTGFFERHDSSLPAPVQHAIAALEQDVAGGELGRRMADRWQAQIEAGWFQRKPQRRG